MDDGHRWWTLVLAAGGLLLPACGQEPPAGFYVASPAISNEGAVAAQFTCDSSGLSPPLQWGHVPTGTVSLALTLDDADVPGGPYSQWVLYNLPADSTGVPQDQQAQLPIFHGATQGRNGSGRLGYDDVCPPRGDKEHHYYFKLYALNTALGLPAGDTRAQLVTAMQGHVLGQAQFMAIYERPAPMR